MRPLVLAVLVVLVVAAPAAADYRRLPGPPADAGYVFQGENLLVGAAGVLTAHRPDGSARVIKLPKTRGRLRQVEASGQALAVEMSHTWYAGLNGGSWRKLGGLRVTGGVSGSDALVLREDKYEEKATLALINLRSGATRRFRFNDERSLGVQVVGDYLAHYTHFAVGNREAIVVRRRSTGRVVYRKRFGRIANFTLLPGGKVVVSTPGSYRSAWLVRIGDRGRWRTIREVSAVPTGGIRATPAGVAMIRWDAQGRNDIWLMGYDGRMRPLTPLGPAIDGFAFDGRRLAFNVEGCVFTGPIPPPGAPLPAVPAEGCVTRGRDG